MSKSYYVARTAPGLPHGNTLILRNLWKVVIFLDDPGELRSLQDRYQLLSDEGLYEQTLPRSETMRQDEKRLALRFTEVVPEGTYSLYHRLTPDVKYPVFSKVPFEALEDHGEETPEPSNEIPDLPTLQEEPELLSGDPLLKHHSDDLAFPGLEENGFFWDEVRNDLTHPRVAVA